MSSNQSDEMTDDHVLADETAMVGNERGVSSVVPTVIRRRFLNEMLVDFPEPIKVRLRALKQLQLKTTELEAQFYTEVHALECKYHQMYSPLFDKRMKIVTGVYQPTEEESQWNFPDVTSDVLNKIQALDLYDTEDSEATKCRMLMPPADAIGIPDFWLHVFRNVSLLSEMVQEHDEPVLKHLLDIKVIHLEKDPMGFVLEFHFSPNEYFSNSVLTKEYSMKCAPDEEDPFSFEGPEIYKCVGCKIDWLKGKNLTMKLIKKKQKHKARGSVRTITRQVPNDSFFNFFNPPILPEDDPEIDEETQQLLSTDYEIGHYLRERIIPRAVLYYTGEGLGDEEEEEELEEEEEDEGDEEEDEEEEVFKPELKSGHKKKIPKGMGKDPDCKQQ